MGWTKELQRASFRGVEFDCTSTNGSTSKALSVHQAPYSNDALIEDNGTDPEKISLRIFLAGDNYFEYLEALITAFRTTGEGELVHPIHGLKNVFTANWTEAHDTETVDGCYIDVDFLVATQEQKQLFVPVAFIDTASLLDLPASAFKRELEILQNTNPNKFFQVINRIRTGLQKARQILNTIRSTVDNLLSPPDWAVGLVNDVVSLATFEINDISAISKWTSIKDRIKRISKIFDQDDNNNDSPAFKQLWRAIGNAATAETVQSLVKQTRTELVQNQIISLTPIDLAVIRQQVRKDINHSIKVEREITQDQATISNIDPSLQVAEYKKLANQVHVQIQSVIETRPPLSNALITVNCTAHWLAHKLYGDMSRAEEIKRLNPNFFNFALLRSGTELMTYAR